MISILDYTNTSLSRLHITPKQKCWSNWFIKRLLQNHIQQFCFVPITIHTYTRRNDNIEVSTFQWSNVITLEANALRLWKDLTLFTSNQENIHLDYLETLKMFWRKSHKEDIKKLKNFNTINNHSSSYIKFLYYHYSQSKRTEIFQ